MKPSFIYPQINQAKISLMRAVNEAQGEVHRNAVIASWFDRHIFEMGVEIATDRSFMIQTDAPQEDITKRTTYNAARKLVDEIMKSGSFTHQINYDPFSRFDTFKIFIMACPQYVGPGTREAK
jgi:hypothetical protein